MLGQPIKAFEWEDHEAYIAAHSSFIQNPMVSQNQNAVQMISANIQEHQAMLYKIQIEEAMGQPLPPLEELQKMPPEQSQQIMNEIAQAAPDIHNLKEAYRRMYEALEIKNPETLFKPEPQVPEVPPRDPISEQQAAMLGQPIKAFEWEDHEAYIAAHSSFIQNPMVSQNQNAVQMISANIQEHQAMLYKIQIEEAMGQPLPPLEQLQQMPPEQSQQIMNEIAQAATQATAQVTGRAEAMAKAEEIEKMDPIIELQRAEIRQKAVAADQKVEVDREKIESQEAIAEMKIAAQREKDVQSSILEADRTYADILNTVREADERTRGE